MVSDITESSGNVFADLGFPDADELLARAELTRRICAILKRRGLTQEQAAKLLDLKQPDVSLLMRGRYTRFSTDRLFRLLNVLDQDVEIVVRRKPRSRPHGRVSVVAP
ncbi:MAG: XRE family transcriptional regulator [Proteobacteria bacterium]|nr:XRE family transcriptional regulator [Pseudomonadota bacterium]